VLGALAGNLSATGKRFAIVVSRFNAFITSACCKARSTGWCAAVARKKTYSWSASPAPSKILPAARTLAETKQYDAITARVPLRALPPTRVIVNEVARVSDNPRKRRVVPHAFGVLTCETLEQAIDRAA